RPFRWPRVSAWTRRTATQRTLGDLAALVAAGDLYEWNRMDAQPHGPRMPACRQLVPRGLDTALGGGPTSGLDPAVLCHLDRGRPHRQRDRFVVRRSRPCLDAGKPPATRCLSVCRGD